MSCTKCGKELKKGEKFCPYCGTKAETEKTDSGDILKPVSSKVAEGATYAAEQIKQIDVNDMKGIFTNVTSTDSIVYLIAGSLLLFTSIYSFFEWMDSKILFLSFMSAAFLYIYFFITKKKTKGGGIFYTTGIWNHGNLVFISRTSMDSGIFKHSVSNHLCHDRHRSVGSWHSSDIQGHAKE